jgi:tripartite ATP-independent transporter DctM subunit
MPWIEATVILFGGLMLIMAFGVPVAIAFLAVNLVGAAIFLGGEAGLVQFNRNAVQSVTAFALTPIPFFVLMGEVLFHSGVAMKAIDAFALLIRRVPGRLSVIAIVAGTVFSAISGSTIATTALLGSLMLPTMLARGYHPNMAMGPIMGIGGVDMLIPPSALTVLLGSLAGISISGLLIGGIIPGLMLSTLFIGYIVLRVLINPELAPAEALEAAPGIWERWGPFFLYVLPLLSIFGLVVGAMSAGWATPTEAAALGAAGTIVAAFCYRGLTFRNLMQSLLGTVAISGIILFIIVGATTFSQVLSFSGVVNGIIGLITGQGLSPTTVLMGMILILLLLGCFVDQVSMMLITLPFFMPLVVKLNFDPVWFGIVFLICMQLGLLTPPFGLLLYTMKGVAPPSITMNQIYMAALPYVLFGLLVLLLIVLFPPLATWLPSILGS